MVVFIGKVNNYVENQMRQSHAHAEITEPWRQNKNPAENNNPEEEREEVKKLTPHTHTAPSRPEWEP